MQPVEINVINSCRLCGGNITELWNFGLLPSANHLKNSPIEKEFKCSLSYFKCDQCHSVQLGHDIDLNFLYSNYQYESPPNLTLQFENFAKEVTRNLKINNQTGSFLTVCDIGSNNGLLLEQFQKINNCFVLGIEPAKHLAIKARSKGIRTLNDFFGFQTPDYLKGEYFKLFVSTNCFAHNPNLNDFVSVLGRLMPSNGYFVFENCYLLDTLNNLDIGQLYFDHFYLHSVTPLVKLFDRHGMELFKVEHTDVQMGSIRCYVRWKCNRELKRCDSVDDYLDKERSAKLDCLNTYKIFLNKIDDLKNRLVTKLSKLERPRIAVYGHPAKYTLIHKYFKLDKYVEYIVEESDLKIGKYAPGTTIKIVDLEYAKQNPPTHFIIGAYNFEKDIIKKNDWFKGEWINPLMA